MFLKLTELTLDSWSTTPPAETKIFVQSDHIMVLRPRGEFNGQTATSIYMGVNHWPLVKETPEEIIDMVYGQCK